MGQGTRLRLRPWQKDFILNVYGPQDDKGNRKVRRALLSVSRKNGKGLALDTPLPTPTGWTTMGDVRPGDVLLDENGHETRVRYVSEIKQLDCYRVTFSNGEIITCDGDHRWLTTARVARPGRGHDNTPAPRAAVRDTRELFATQRTGSRGDANHSIPRAKPLLGRAAVLPVDPYVLGAWLGDGSTASARLTCGEQDLDETAALLRACDITVSARRERTAYTLALQTPGASKGSPDNLQKKLRALGVLGGKHIPRAYLRASYAQRLALLQGLMDTDGYVSPEGGVFELTTTLPRLAEGIHELLATFGLKFSVRGKRLRCNRRDVPGLAWVFCFYTFKEDLEPFRLQRKRLRMRSRVETRRAPRSDTIQIVSIERVPTVPTKCIQVDSPNSLFLCGRSMIPTHNTALAAALVLVHLIGPEAKRNGEVYSAATDRNQATHIYKMCAQMIELDDELRGMCACMAATKRIVCYQFGSFYQSLSADARRQHGFNPTFVVYDELAQAKSRELYDVLSTSFGAQEEALLLVISTQSSDPQSIMTELSDDALAQERGELADDTFYGKVYYLPDKLADGSEPDIYDETNWRAANPALADFRSLADVRALAAKAKRSPSAEASFRNLFLNQRVDGVEAFVTSGDWRACGERPVSLELLARCPTAGALDLGSRQDLCAFSLAWELDGLGDDYKGRVATRAWYWTPGEEIAERETRDGARYREWAAAGHIKIVPGKAVDYGVVAKDVSEIVKHFNLIGINYDAWRIDEFKRELGHAGVPEERLRLSEFVQGYKSFTPALDTLETKIIEHLLAHDTNPVTTWCLSNVRVLRDPAGNRKFDKRQRHRRIDGAVALAMSVGSLASIERPAKPFQSVYETRGIRRL